ncbi:hypothetical protein QJS10_CPA06g02066 [Acorus calamus]|uniref:Signal peptidase complex-like protein DTM1 n=1 Tax=Acorus calamus TaxID=4465 RepID=A0AAV9EL81_ACOCL|nr:hypothetical protein QJS10_CPA06g02066 [Acorus calamus]
MATKDDALRSSLVSLGAVIVLIGICTFSFKKMFVTYAFGLFAIAGLVLPDWEFFDRDVSQWFSPMPFDDARGRGYSDQITRSGSNNDLKALMGVALFNGNVIHVNAIHCGHAAFFKFYPLRTILYTVVYGVGLYKWWTYITS